MATAATPLENQLPPAPGAKPPQEDPELTRLKGEVAKHKATLDDVLRRVAAPPAAPAPAASGNPPTETELNKQFYQAPVKHTMELATHVAQQVLRDAVEGSQATLITVAKNEARGSDPIGQKIFDKYASEIETTAMSADPKFRANVMVWKNAVSYVKGLHMTEIMQEFYGQQPQAEPTNRAPAVHIKEGGGPGQPSARPGQAPKAEELSADEKMVAKKLNISEDQYRAGKEHYNNQNDQRFDPVGPSSWDKPFPGGLMSPPTFSTKALRKSQREAAKKGVAA